MKPCQVNHFEIPMDDVERAQNFYKENFGWNIMKMPDMPYWGAQNTELAEDQMTPKEPGTINGGMFERGDSNVPSGVVVITVPDIETSLAKVEETGGKRFMPDIVDVGDFGRYIQFTDTEGNVLGMWQYKKKE